MSGALSAQPFSVLPPFLSNAPFETCSNYVPSIMIFCYALFWQEYRRCEISVKLPIYSTWGDQSIFQWFSLLADGGAQQVYFAQVSSSIHYPDSLIYFKAGGVCTYHGLPNHLKPIFVSWKREVAQFWFWSTHRLFEGCAQCLKNGCMNVWTW